MTRRTIHDRQSWMAVTEAAEYMGCSVSGFRAWARERNIKTKKDGRKKLYHVGNINRHRRKDKPLVQPCQQCGAKATVRFRKQWLCDACLVPDVPFSLEDYEGALAAPHTLDDSRLPPSIETGDGKLIDEKCDEFLREKNDLNGWRWDDTFSAEVKK